MKINTKKGFSFFTLTCFMIMLTVLVTAAEEKSSMSNDAYTNVMRGGLLYDKWYSVLEVKTTGTHPSYPAEGKKKGASTWRCKECHGWDYMGKDGAYAKGSHYSGIKGIRESAGKKPSVIMDILKNDAHAIGDMIPDREYEALAFFVAYGQTDMDAHIDRTTKKAKGNANTGARIYAGICSKCHGTDGREINFKTAEKPQYLGTLSKKNPWETLHKIRYGQPDTEMASLYFLDVSDQVDVLSYCQTLPVK